MAKRSRKNGKRQRVQKANVSAHVAARSAASAAFAGGEARRKQAAVATVMPAQLAITAAASPHDDRFTLGLMLAPVLLVALLLMSGKAITLHIDAPTLADTITLRWPAVATKTPTSVSLPDVRPPVEITYRNVAPTVVPVALSLSVDRPLTSPVPAPVSSGSLREAQGLRITADLGAFAGSPHLPATGIISPAIRDDRIFVPTVFRGVVVPALLRDDAGRSDSILTASLLDRGQAGPTALPARIAPSLTMAALAPPAMSDLIGPLPTTIDRAPPALFDAVPDLLGPPPRPPTIGQSSSIAPFIAAGVCRPARIVKISIDRTPQPLPQRAMLDAASFGLALARAAEQQSEDLVFYTANYRRVAYPRGDVSPMHGACSDVVIRAYRHLGIDLQEHVQRARVGSGDANIDHRRTDTLRKLFERLGAALPPSAFPEDYKPGDIVTYYRPHSRISRAHIAIVSDRLSASGRPMVIHNRGWGVQIEDALFADAITGHYRLTNAMVPPEAPVARIANMPSGTIAAPAVTRSDKRSRQADFPPRAGDGRKIAN